ncbi:hypothetical protein A0H81_14938 [Grifola frondosa]|uniref:Uncharacterized protein n=1 Tax=Grifola frondosa TaxID=5627 RepID=A0A1C7LQM5_GRIFR|nr:hypothetical protein A0H81_14938 [Grifola frondosa]
MLSPSLTLEFDLNIGSRGFRAPLAPDLPNVRRLGRDSETLSSDVMRHGAKRRPEGCDRGPGSSAGHAIRLIEVARTSHNTDVQFKNISTTLITILVGAVDVSASPGLHQLLGARNACKLPDGTIEVRDLHSQLVTERDGCDLSNAGGAGNPGPNA